MSSCRGLADGVDADFKWKYRIGRGVIRLVARYIAFADVQSTKISIELSIRIDDSTTLKCVSTKKDSSRGLRFIGFVLGVWI